MKISVFISNRASFNRQKELLNKMEADPDIKLHLIITSGLLETSTKDLRNEIVDTFEKVKTIPMNYFRTLDSMASSVGFLTTELCKHYNYTKPRAVMVLADRFELMAAAIAASYKQIPLIHIQGGEVSGNIDDKVRNAISCLADYHFPTCEPAAKRLRKMGCDNVFNFGCPSYDIVKKFRRKEGEHLIVFYHPHTKELGSINHQMDMLFQTVSEVMKENHINKCYWFTPNNDPGSRDIHTKLGKLEEFEVVSNLPIEEFLELLSSSKAIVGNSSACIREASIIGVPAVVVGDRQENRDHDENAVFCKFEYNILKRVIKSQIKAKYNPSNFFGKNKVSPKIIRKIKEVLNG